ncbi:mCG145429, partial [Mus musculus]
TERGQWRRKNFRRVFHYLVAATLFGSQESLVAIRPLSWPEDRDPPGPGAHFLSIGSRHLGSGTLPRELCTDTLLNNRSQYFILPDVGDVGTVIYEMETLIISRSWGIMRQWMRIGMATITTIIMTLLHSQVSAMQLRWHLEMNLYPYYHVQS